MNIIAIVSVSVTACMYVHSPHVGSALYMHGPMGITVGCLPPQHLGCSGAYMYNNIIKRKNVCYDCALKGLAPL